MIYFLHILRQILWVVPLLLQAVIAVMMIRFGLVRAFPLFFSYTALVLSRDLILLFLPYPRNLYSLVYWSGEALAVLLGLGVIFETLRYLLPPYPFLRTVWRLIWAIGALVGTAALWMLVFSDGSSGVDRVLEAIILAERAARFSQVCLLVVVIAFMSRMGLTWHHYSLGIVAGFGIYAALDLAALELRGHLHFVTDDAFVLIRPAAYNLATGIWAVYFLRPWRRMPVEPLPKTNLKELNKTVTGYVDKWYRQY